MKYTFGLRCHDIADNNEQSINYRKARNKNENGVKRWQKKGFNFKL